MPKRPTSPPVTITCVGSLVTVTYGADSRKSSCATSNSAKSLATRLKNDPQFLKRWLGFKPAEQLPLPFDIARRVMEVPTYGHTQAPVSGGLIEEPSATAGAIAGIN